MVLLQHALEVKRNLIGVSAPYQLVLEFVFAPLIKVLNKLLTPISTTKW